MFEIESLSIFGSSESSGNGHQRPAEPMIKSTISQTATDGPRKILLPRRPGESRFAPLQYYYPASRTGVMPGWCANAEQAKDRQVRRHYDDRVQHSSQLEKF